MRFFNLLAFVVAMVAICCGSSYGAPATNMQQKELFLLVDSFNKAAAEKNVEVFVDNMPARLIHEMAVRMNATEQDLRASLQAKIEQQMKLSPNFVYRLDRTKITFEQTHDGTFYALIPTHVETKNDVTDFLTLALFENTKWHLIYGGLKAVKNPIFLEIYPAFTNVKFPDVNTSHPGN